MASDGETKDPMETSTGSEFGQRGPEDISTEDAGVDDEEEESEDSEDEDWDKDSFDGLVYNSEEDKEYYSDKEFERRARNYNRKVIESKGFFEPTTDAPLYLWTGIATVDDDMDREVPRGSGSGVTYRQFLSNMAIACVNKRRNEGKTLNFVEYVRANYNPGGRSKFYITFMATESDSPDAPKVEYQAKVVWTAGRTIPILCRPSPPKKDQGNKPA